MSGIERLTSFFLLLVIVLAVFPMEQPGMLYPWLGITPNTIFQVKVLKFGVIELLLGLTLVSAMMYKASRNGGMRYRNFFGGIFWLIFLCIIWGYMGTIAEGGRFSLENMGIVNWRRLIYGMVLFVAITLYVDDREKLKKALLMVIMATIVLDIYGLSRYIFFGGIPVHHYIGKVVFWETSKLALNVFVVVLCLGALLLPGADINPRERRLYTFALLLAYAVIFLSARRTSLVMAIIATGIFVVIMARRGRAALASVIVGAGSIVVIVFALFNYEALETKFISRFQSIAGVFDTSVEIDKGSTQGHVRDLIEGWKTVMEHPVWGVGFAWSDTGKEILESGGRGRFWVHNALLTFWMRFGIAGVLTYFYIYYKAISVLYRNYRRTGSPLSGAFAVWFSVEFMAGLFFPPFFGYFKMVALFMGTLALANAHLNTMALEAGQPRQTAGEGKPRSGGILRYKRDIMGESRGS